MSSTTKDPSASPDPALAATSTVPSTTPPVPTPATTTTTPAAPPKKKEQSIFEKYGIYIASFGFGLAFLFLGIIIYLLLTRSPPDYRPRLPMSIPPMPAAPIPAPAPVSPLAAPPTDIPMSGPASSTPMPSQVPPAAPATDIPASSHPMPSSAPEITGEPFNAPSSHYEEMPDSQVRSPLSAHFPSDKTPKPVGRMDGGYCGPDYCGAGGRGRGRGVGRLTSVLNKMQQLGGCGCTGIMPPEVALLR